MGWQADQESFERGLMLGAIAAEIAMKQGGSVGLRQFVADNEAKITARWENRDGPRKMVAGDIFILIPMMTAADLGLSRP